jgi:molybdenum cofactor synthesis domain-containing protein
VHDPKTLRVQVVVLSDRASRGNYEDRSGPAIEEAFDAFFQGRRWHPCIERAVLPDDATRLRQVLEDAVAAGTDIVVTSGGTGVGPRDITPEVVEAFCDKTIPGIMEWIRVKYGADKPRALLSRSVAGVKDRMLVYAVPGSLRAAGEYLAEIVKTLEHLVMTVHGVDAH